MALDGTRPTGARVDVWPHPLTAEGRHDAVAPAGITLGQAVRDAGFGSRPVRAWIDGREVKAELVDDRELEAGEIVTLRADVRGGGGGGGNKLVRTVLSIAVLAAAVFIPPLLGFAAGTVGAALASAGVLVAGNLLVNALVPPEIPRLDGPGTDRSTPVYSLSGGANRPRHYAPMLMVLGRHRIFPDLDMTEHSAFDDQEQFLYQIVDLGVGDLDAGPLRTGATPLADIGGVTQWRALGGGATPRFDAGVDQATGRFSAIAGNVDTVAGAELADTVAVARVATDCARIEVDLVARVFMIDDMGETQENSVSVEIRATAQGQPAQGPWTMTITGDDQGQVRRTFARDLPAIADWTVSVRRTAAPSEEDRTYDDVAFTALRAFQADTGNYARHNRIGLRMKASAKLQGRLDRLNLDVWQKVPVWDGSAWTAPMRTSNPAWIARWWALGVWEDGELVAGLGMDADRIDEDGDVGVKAFGAWCDAQGLACDFVIDREREALDILRMIAACGRASPTGASGKMGFVWDAGGQPATALITPGNIVKGSFGTEWASGSLAEEVAVRYLEPDMDWQWNTIRKLVPGVTGTPARTATVTLEGVTSAVQAAGQAGLLAAGHRYRKRRMTWEMSAEGLAIRRGQVVNVTHSLIDGGITGRLRGGTADAVDLDREVTLTGDDWLMLRLLDGTRHVTAVSAPQGVTGDTDRLVLASPLPDAPDANGPAFDVLWRLYDSGDPPATVKVIATRPVSDRGVRIVAMPEDARYYLGANERPGSTDLRSHGPPEVVWISIARSQIRVGNGFATQLEAVLTVAGAWEGAEVRVGRGTAESVRTVAALQGDSLAARWIEEPRGEITVTAIPFLEGRPYPEGARSVEYDFTPLYDIAPPTDPGVSAESDGTRVFTWTPPNDPDLAGIVIRYAADPDAADDDDDIAWGAMTPLHEGVLTASPFETNALGAGDWQFAFRALSTSGELSDIVRVTRNLGAGRVGSTLWLTGSGDPDASLGKDGDIYLDATAKVIWQKRDGAWSRLLEVDGADGAQWYFGSAAPNNTTPGGADGDFYFRTGSGTVAGEIWRKASGSWTKAVDIDQGTQGAVWHGGEDEPANGLGNVGDWYFRSSNGFVYEKTGETTWTFRRDITGPAGINGTLWHAGTGVPATALGTNGDFYIRTTTNQVYRKASGSWSLSADFSGADGATWLSGSGAPSNSAGSNGDWYFRTGSGSVAAEIYRKVSGAWVKQIDIDQGADGNDGSIWHFVSGTPGGSLGAVGDWAFNGSNGYVYQKTGTSTWTFRRDITGPKGDAASLPTGVFVQTANIALSATGEVFAADASGSFTIAESWTQVARIATIPGGAGFRLLVYCTFTFLLSARTLNVRILRGSTIIDTSSLVLPRSDLKSAAVTVSGAVSHPSASALTVEFRQSNAGGRSGFTGAGQVALLAFLQKR